MNKEKQEATKPDQQKPLPKPLQKPSSKNPKKKGNRRNNNHTALENGLATLEDSLNAIDLAVKENNFLSPNFHWPINIFTKTASNRYGY